jgi:hypothetical protein
VAAGPFDHPRRHEDTRGQRRIITQKVRRRQARVCTLVYRGALRLYQAASRRPVLPPHRHGLAAPSQPQYEPRCYPGLGFWRPWTQLSTGTAKRGATRAPSAA